MQYQGGKSRIANTLTTKIRELHPTATEIWEPFCGGGAMTLALAKAGFRVHASDSHEDLILMWQALMRGEVTSFADVTETEYQALKTAQPSARRGFVGFGSSFGGAWFGGFARRKTSGGEPAKAQPYEESQRFCQKLIGQPVVFTHADYTAVSDSVLVYADPPYVGTKPYKGGAAFDHVAFWAWVKQRSGPTFVSELTGPEDIEIVWRKQHKSQNASNSPTTRATSQIIEREERLYYKPGRCGLLVGGE
jgi:site-specific DNA-adenine methylase